MLAQKRDRVVATDISERAVALARLNAALDGMANVECRVGDLFEPVERRVVRHRRLAASVSSAGRHAGPATFLFGGPRGDEISMRAAAWAARVAVTCAARRSFWPNGPPIEGDAPLDVRFAEALGAPSNLGMLHVRLPDASIDEHCARYATIAAPARRRELRARGPPPSRHFEKMRIRAAAAHGHRGAP